MKRTLFVLAVTSILLTACVSRSELVMANETIAELQAQVATVQGQFALKAEELASEQAKAKELADEKATLEADLAQAKKDYEQSRTRATSLASEVDKYKCSGQITDMKYGNIMDASTILSAWWAKQPNVEQVGTPYRDKIWSNAMTQIHGIRFTSSEDHEPYVEHFLVYFDEFEMKPGVFWIGGQCWLDPP